MDRNSKSLAAELASAAEASGTNPSILIEHQIHDYSNASSDTHDDGPVNGEPFCLATPDEDPSYMPTPEDGPSFKATPDEDPSYMPTPEDGPSFKATPEDNVPSFAYPRKINQSTTEAAAPSVVIDRPVYNQPNFAHQNPATLRDRRLKTKTRLWFHKKMECSKDCCSSFVLGLFPFIRIMRAYSLKDDLVNDLISGITVGIMQIPQGM